jgi:hypothetical protein
MTSRGQIQIDVIADTTKFAAQVEREIKAIAKGLKLTPVKLDADTAAFVGKIRKAQADVDSSFSGLFKKIKGQAEAAGKGIGTALVAGLGAAASSGIGPALSGITALLAGVGPAAAAGIPAAVGALGTLSVALFGVSDAVKHLIDGDLEKFEGDLEKLSPAAVKFFRALQGLGPQLSAIKNAVQDRFFAGFDQDLTKVAANLLGPVKTGMTGVAGDLNELVRSTLEYAASSKGADAFTGILRATRQILAEVDKVLGPVIDKFLDLVIAGTDAKRIDAALSTAKATLKGLGDAAANVQSAIGSIFKGLSLDGPEVAKGLADATKAVKDFLASAQAQDLLNTLGDAMDRVREIALKILDALPALTPAVSGLASGGFGVLLGVAETLADVLTAVSGELGGQKDLFATVGAAVAVAVVAVKAYQAALVAVAAAQIAWTAATVAGSAAMTAATAVYNTARVAVLLTSTAFVAAGAQATIFATAVYGTVTAMVAASASALRTAAVVVASQIQQTAAMLATNAAWAALVVRAAAAQAATIAFAAAQRAVAIATNLWTAAQWLLNAAMTANPIGIVIAIIVALVAAIVYAYKNSETFRNIVDGAFRAVGAAAIWLWENALKPLWAGIVAGFNFVKAAAIAWWQLVVTVFNGVTGAASAVASAVVGFFRGLVSGASAQISALVGFVSSLPGRILSVLGNVGRLLYNVGSSIVAGLRDGIAGAWHWVTDKVQSLINLIPASIRSLLGISSPSKVTMALGMATGQGFAQGIAAQVPQVTAATRQLVSGAQMSLKPAPTAVSGGVRGGDGAQAAAVETGGVRVWPSQPRSEPTVLTIDSRGSQLDNLLLQVLGKAVRVRGGNVQTVLGKSQGGVT